VVSRHHVLPDAFWYHCACAPTAFSVDDDGPILGMKPFGDGMSQEKMLQVVRESHFLFWRNVYTAAQEGTMLRAASAGLTFPTNPKVTSIYILSCRLLSEFCTQVSQEAKDFIKRCLARVDQRPDVLALYTDSYVRNKSREVVAVADSK
jgi:hypothetical protein